LSLTNIPPARPQLAKAEKLKPMELTLRKLEDMTENIAQSFLHLKQREAEHRDTNGKTIKTRGTPRLVVAVDPVHF
jgi:hypothetical protein